LCASRISTSTNGPTSNSGGKVSVKKSSSERSYPVTSDDGGTVRLYWVVNHTLSFATAPTFCGSDQEGLWLEYEVYAPAHSLTPYVTWG